MRYSLFFILCLYSTITVAYPQELVSGAKKFLQQKVSAYPGKIEINIQPPDYRLQLNPCKSAINYTIGSSNKISSKTILIATCNDIEPWRINITTDIKQLVNVVTARKHIRKGDIYSSDNIYLKEQNVLLHNGNYSTLLESVIGKVAKSNLAPNKIVDNIHITSDPVIKKGDLVSIVIETSNLAVSAGGVAMQDGFIGNSIKVRNTQSNRIVSGQVIASNKIQILN